MTTPTLTGPDPDEVHANPPAARRQRSKGPPSRGVPDLDPAVLGAIGVTGATTIEVPKSQTGSTVTWTGTLTVPQTGRYSFSLTGVGAAALTLDSVSAVADTVPHDGGTWSGSIDLIAGHPYRVALPWTPVADAVAIGVPSTMDLGMAFVGDAIAEAVAAARACQVAVVFAADYSAETFDRPSLSLPGDQDALIAAVAAANPRTVVVLNTGGPVLMPWLGSVSSVLEAWYSGEQDGAAVAALLTGDVSPAGHLPVTFPASQAESAIARLAQWPGIGLSSTYSEGLKVGYRFNQATGTKPLFPFGFGLSYTTFACRHAFVTPRGTGYVVTATVTNTGTRSGADVVQAYLTFPKGAGEPPNQLVAFAPVAMLAGQTRVVMLDIPGSALQVFVGGRWTPVKGRFHLGIGDSSASQPAQTSFTVR